MKLGKKFCKKVTSKNQRSFEWSVYYLILGPFILVSCSLLLLLLLQLWFSPVPQLVSLSLSLFHAILLHFIQLCSFR